MAKRGSVGDIVHSAGVRYRTLGEGLLRTRMYNMGTPGDDENAEKYKDLEPIALSRKTGRERTVIANFQDQAMQVQFRTIHIDEVFTISKIVNFVKPVAESYPIKSGAR
jgi:hypothetical protein